MNSAHRVAIIVAPMFAVELERIARERRFWALRLPEYERVAKERWSTALGDALDSGVTLFNGGG